MLAFSCGLKWHRQADNDCNLRNSASCVLHSVLVNCTVLRKGSTVAVSTNEMSHKLFERATKTSLALELDQIIELFGIQIVETE